MNNKKIKNSGITLIALVITIIVLLILAAVSVATLTGNNGLLSKAEYSKIKQRGATAKEYIDLWKTEKKMGSYTNNLASKTQEELLDDLEDKKLLLNDERERLESGETITIGDVSISLGEIQLSDLEKLKLYFVGKTYEEVCSGGVYQDMDPIPDASSTISNFQLGFGFICYNGNIYQIVPENESGEGLEEKVADVILKINVGNDVVFVKAEYDDNDNAELIETGRFSVESQQSWFTWASDQENDFDVDFYEDAKLKETIIAAGDSESSYIRTIKSSGSFAYEEYLANANNQWMRIHTNDYIYPGVYYVQGYTW